MEARREAKKGKAARLKVIAKNYGYDSVDWLIRMKSRQMMKPIMQEPYECLVEFKGLSESILN